MNADGDGSGRDELRWFSDQFTAIVRNVEMAISGKTEVIEKALVCLLAEGHLLIEDVPGLGKTSLARAIAASIDAESKRMQFTPDLLPSDVTGVTVFDQRSGEFSFHPGSIFANLVVADEINRASPKTQSALLEAMEEGQVSVDSTTHVLPSPFMVLATQNPIDLSGTYRLPEAQMDRFLMRISMGYPDRDHEIEIALRRSDVSPVSLLSPVVDRTNVLAMIQCAAEIYVNPDIAAYIVDLAVATRRLSDTQLGVSPRGILAMVRAAKALAASRSRGFVIPEDVQQLAPAVFSHRLILTPDAEIRRVTGEALVGEVLANVPIPSGTPVT